MTACPIPAVEVSVETLGVASDVGTECVRRSDEVEPVVYLTLVCSLSAVCSTVDHCWG